MAEMQHHQIRLYPFDSEENDETELQLNERIRVSPVDCTSRSRADNVGYAPVRHCRLGAKRCH